jgi:hypothetical protein
MAVAPGLARAGLLMDLPYGGKRRLAGCEIPFYGAVL